MVLQMYGLPVGFYFGVNVNLFELKGKIQKDFVESPLPKLIDSLAFAQTVLLPCEQARPIETR